MNRTAVAALALAATVFAATVFAAPALRAETFAYPTAADPSFLIDVPKSWEPTPADEDGGYALLTGPTGVELWFRTIPATENALQGAIEESVEYLQQTYTDVKLDPAQDSEQNGLEGFYGTGSGKYEGSPVVFVLAWYVLPDDTIGEIWFVADPEDEAGAAAAAKILDSFRAP